MIFLNCHKAVVYVMYVCLFIEKSNVLIYNDNVSPSVDCFELVNEDTIFYLTKKYN
jgi:hypothetical protein